MTARFRTSRGEGSMVRPEIVGKTVALGTPLVTEVRQARGLRRAGG